MTLSNLTQSGHDDLDILLVSPWDKKVMLLSDADGDANCFGVRLTPAVNFPVKWPWMT